MCVVSMVYDYYGPFFPPPVSPWVPQPPTTVPISPWQPYDLSPPPEGKTWEQLIKEFHEAVEAAKVVDRATGQPDCTDPEKAKLEACVAELERRLAELSPKPKRKAKKAVKKAAKTAKRPAKKSAKRRAKR